MGNTYNARGEVTGYDSDYKKDNDLAVKAKVQSAAGLGSLKPKKYKNGKWVYQGDKDYEDSPAEAGNKKAMDRLQK